jgi:SAM-dependent methyltransferase
MFRTLEMLGLALEGAALVACARVEEGMRCLDEATATALDEEATIPISSAWACCFLVGACTSVLDFERAFEWCDRIAEFAERHESPYMHGFCRAEYGAVHVWRGRWAEAERLLDASFDDFSRARPAMAGAPLVALAELRVLAARAAWAAGDYHRFATELVWQLGPVLVAACGVSPGQRVLDVAAGTGNVAIRAAEAGAEVVASDLTPENFEAGREEARARGVELEWVEADAESLPFADGAFDVVTSSFGAMFAPDHQAVAGELVRVCRPGGTIGMANFTPDGLGGEFFAVFAPYLPAPPPGALPPVLWGSEEHVRDLFGDRVESLELTRKDYVERAASPRDYCEFFKATFGPVVALYESLGTSPTARRRSTGSSWTSRRARTKARPRARPSIATSTCSWWRALPEHRDRPGTRVPSDRRGGPRSPPRVRSAAECD